MNPEPSIHSVTEPPAIPQDELLRLASRTFAVGIERLPGDLCAAIRSGYLLLRVSDYLEDDAEMASDVKCRLLLLWDAVLAGDEDVAALLRELPASPANTPDAEVAMRADDVYRAALQVPEHLREPVIRHVRLSTQGMARWVERGPAFSTEADLDDYMHQVAGLVGYLLTQTFAAHSSSIARYEDRLMPLAREFGLGLQTVNVIRGLPQDFARGWIYIPAEWARAEGLLREEIFDVKNRAAAMRIVDRLCRKAERHLEGAREYVRMLPRREHRIRLFCLLPMFFAVRTLALSRGNESVFGSGAKMSRAEVRSIVRRTTLLGWSRSWVDREAARLGA